MASNAVQLLLDENAKQLFPRCKVTEILPGKLFIGRRLCLNIPQLLFEERNIKGIIQLSMNYPMPPLFLGRIQQYVKPGDFLRIACLNLETEDLLLRMEESCSFINRILKDSNSEDQGAVLIVSENGRSQCSAIALAYLMYEKRMPMADIIKELSLEDKVHPNPGFLRQLDCWERMNYCVWQDDEKTIRKDEYEKQFEEGYISRKAPRQRRVDIF